MQLLYGIEVKIPEGCTLSPEQMCLLNRQLGVIGCGAKLWCDMSTLVLYCTGEPGPGESLQSPVKKRIVEEVLKEGGLPFAECKDRLALEDMLCSGWLVLKEERVVFGKRFVIEEEKRLLEHGYKKCPTCRLVRYQLPHECDSSESFLAESPVEQP